MKFDFAKNINFKPLEEMGIKRQRAVKLLGAMMPFIDLEFKGRIRSAFDKTELKKIGQEAEKKGIKPEDGVFFLEEKYHLKTGRYFMEEMRLIYNQYVVDIAKIIQSARQELKRFVKSDKGKQQKLEKLIVKNKMQEAAKMIDEMLKNTKVDNDKS